MSIDEVWEGEGSPAGRGETPRPPRYRAWISTFPMALALVLAPGCEREEQPASRQPISMSELPVVVRDAAKKALPEITFNEARKNLDRDGKLQSYEVKGRAPNGKIREVRVSLTGQILEME